jgi:membrane protein implicated in regulation of membrane protease activity
MAWWLWMALGLALLAGEMVTPGGFYVFFFGVAALLVGVLGGLGIAGPVWLQWLLFSILSVASVLVLREPLKRRMGSGGSADGEIDTLVGEQAVILDDMPPGAVGKAELRGATWNARNADIRPLARGDRGRVIRVEGLTLALKAS